MATCDVIMSAIFEKYTYTGAYQTNICIDTYYFGDLWSIFIFPENF